MWKGRHIIMLALSDLSHLVDWCRRRGLSMGPARDADGRVAVLLAPLRTPHASVMFLLADEGELMLRDAAGSTLAAASDLPALLDALDGGVGRQPSSRSPHLVATSLPLA